VAGKGLTVYGTWKSAEALENKGSNEGRLRIGTKRRIRAFGLKDVTPAVFVRIANKGLTTYVK
jgi:hypothetical protein